MLKRLLITSEFQLNLEAAWVFLLIPRPSGERVLVRGVKQFSSSNLLLFFKEIKEVYTKTQHCLEVIINKT